MSQDGLQSQAWAPSSLKASVGMSCWGHSDTKPSSAGKSSLTALGGHRVPRAHCWRGRHKALV